MMVHTSPRGPNLTVHLALTSGVLTTLLNDFYGKRMLKKSLALKFTCCFFLKIAIIAEN